MLLRDDVIDTHDSLWNTRPESSNIHIGHWHEGERYGEGPVCHRFRSRRALLLPLSRRRDLYQPNKVLDVLKVLLFSLSLGSQSGSSIFFEKFVDPLFKFGRST